jgi:DNA-binding transcriptional LysR family regulator
MELRHLRYFVAVASTGSYRAAAETLHVAQPSLWQQVQALQTELGVQLFQKVGRGVRLTRSGELLLDKAERVLATAEQMQAAATDLRAGRAGLLAISCYTAHLPRYLAPIIGQFAPRHPNVRLRIKEYEASGGHTEGPLATFADLLDATVDLATGPAPPSELEGVRLGEGRLLALIAPFHKWATRPSVPLSELEGEPLLVTASPDSFSRSAIETACRRAGFAATIKQDSVSAPALAALAQHGIGVAVLPDTITPTDFAGIAIPITGADDLLRRAIWLCWRRGDRASPLISEFIRIAEQIHPHQTNAKTRRPSRRRPRAEPR